MIKTIEDLFEYFPEPVFVGSERHTPCPFCRPGPKVRYHRGRAFYGTDRLIWWNTGVWCRQCHTRMTLSALAKEFDPASEIPSEAEMDTRVVDTPVELISEAFIQARHQTVQRDYWYGFGWTDEVIDKFSLGYGAIKPGAKDPRHLIPFPAQSTDWTGTFWEIEGRSTDPTRAKNVKIGIRGKLYWYINEGTGTTLAVCEGAKDAVSLYQMGFRHILALMGTTTWSDELGERIKFWGYDRVEVYTDNDEAGRSAALRIGSYFRNDLIYVFSYVWPSDYYEGADVSDVLLRYGRDEARGVLESGLRTAPVAGFIQDFTTIEPKYVPDYPQQSKTVGQIRSELPPVLNEYVYHYRELMKSYRKPVLKVLASPPGSGKSYQMLHTAQEYARQVMAQREAERASFEGVEGDPESVERNLKRLAPGQIILYAGPFRAGWEDIINQPGFDENLWYFFDSRNEDNCENFETANILGGKGYNVSAYCKTICPFRQKCEESGYLSQFEKLREKPIAYIRHQHLMDKGLLGRYKLLMVDENPLKVVEQKLRIHARDLSPVVDTWYEYAVPHESKALDELLLMLRRVLNDSLSEYISYTGTEFWDRLRSVGDLDSVLHKVSVDVAEHYQPRIPLLIDGVKLSDLPGRKVPQLIDTLLREYPLYKAGVRYNSRISLVNRSIEIYLIDKIPISRYKPVVVSDGTAWPELYGAAFQREIEVYDPLVRSELANTVVLTGNDFTMRSFRRSTQYLKTDEELEPLPEDDPANEQEETDFQSSEIRSIYNLVKYLEPEHDRILFITTKERRELIESQLMTNYPDMNVDFNHYGNVRGSNAYKDHDAIIVWGAYREPYTSVYRRIQAWASYIGIEQYIPYRIAHRPAPYHGRWEGHGYITLEGEFSERFVDMVEAGEIRQSLDRIRPHTSDRPKTVYVVMSRPVAPWVTELHHGSAVLKQIEVETDDEIMSEISDYFWKRGEMPAYERIAKVFRKSYSRVKEYLSRWEAEQILELDENMQEVLTFLVSEPSMSMTYSSLCQLYSNLTYRNCKALREAVKA